MTTSQPKRQPIPFGKYLLLDRINIGGMAEVWRGKQFGASGFERLVAIKRILPNIAEDDEFISMFIDEAKISVQLTHANIGQIFELGQISSSYFIAMEYIPGKDMRAIFDRCRKKGEPAPIPLVAYCVSKMCEGLDYAHRKKDGMGRDMNIVHRDISPQNILVSYEGEVKVIDFGIAKAAGKATKTQAGILKGKFGYMSPEQIRGLPLDRRSDVFAIGVCLYEMLTGERLFVGESDFSVLEKVRKAEVAPPSTYNRRIPENLEKIVLKALARDVDERYQYASELGDDLQRFLITSETIFGRKDLMQYMKSTFAEEVEREKQRLTEYSTIKPPDGMLAAIEAGFTGAAPAAAPVVQPAPTAPPSLAPLEPPKAIHPPSNPNLTAAGGIRRTASLTALPKLTAAAAVPAPKDDEGVATMLVSPGEYFDDAEEPTTMPGAVGRAITPLETPAAQRLGEGEEPSTGKTAVIGPPPSTHPPMPRAPSMPNLPPVSSPPSVQVRASMIGMPLVTPPGQESPPSARQGRGSDGLPRIARGEPPVLGAAGHAPRPAPALPPEPKSAEHSTDLNTMGGNRKVLFLGAGGAAVALILLLVVLLMPSKPALGFIMVELPAAVRATAKVSLNGEPVASTTGDILQQMPAGPVVVMVSAEGYKAFTQTVTVTEGTQVTRVAAALEAMERKGFIVLSTQPRDAEVKVNGKVLRPQGSTALSFEMAFNGPLSIEVSAPGHEPVTKSYQPPDGSNLLEVSEQLKSQLVNVRVESEPAGASIMASGKSWGNTPADIELPPNVKQVMLRLRCFQDTPVAVTAPAAGESQALLKGTLRKQPGCR
ncbi:serine/threonine-protein kinase [Stigmatella erecta]|uniref:Serine/threonine protein kinase n=1 Tax=Stigmatella erecta TaxID=83460 RepID=A0A1I0D536_9BACT|nr:serine/threonine-protein kinase [Stigmatella erecta]SET27369.1 serine/threonine protein kinase [Stigmatella erecta]